MRYMLECLSWIEHRYEDINKEKDEDRDKDTEMDKKPGRN